MYETSYPGLRLAESFDPSQPHHILTIHLSSQTIWKKGFRISSFKRNNDKFVCSDKSP